jgi:LuxR family transcriptional regulator, maltose regulon positive regulatory protein
MPSGTVHLATKLGVQARGARPVARERLSHLLRSMPEARLVLVSAPAGFGKTTLLAEWIREANLRTAWLSLDPGDNDIRRFAGYLAAATEQLVSGPRDAVEPDPATPFDPELALARILEPVLAAAGHGTAGEVVVVLDDYHLVGEPAIHRLVGQLVDRLPPGARLAIATRADPPLPLARLRARAELLEVRADDLRFTSVEAGELLRSAAVDLPAAVVADLTARTEGWAAALRLAAASMRGRTDPVDLVRKFGATHRFILDYVVEEVLAGLPSETQDFLLCTSILDRLCGPLCDAVTLQAGGRERLELLERANLLITPLDDERCWYRYHALFAEILRARLAVLHPELVAVLHARASAWFEDQRDDDEAIAHALRAGDLERAGELIAVASAPGINGGDLGTVRRWLDALPPEVVRGHGQLSASYAWCLVLTHETAGVAERIADAERALVDGRAGGPLMRAILPAQIALLRSHLAGLERDSGTAIAEARRAAGLVPAGLPPAVEAAVRGDVSVLLGLALLGAGETEAASLAYEAAIPDLRAGGNRLAVGRAIADLASIAIGRGDPARAIRLCTDELARAGEAPAAPSPAVWAALARARAAVGELDLAEMAARRSQELAVRAGDAPSARSAQRTLALIADRAQRRDRATAGARVRSPRNDGDLIEALTPREVEVFRLVALGHTNAQVAAELFVTVGTVKSHVHAISAKLGAANRVEAVALGRRLGLLD